MARELKHHVTQETFDRYGRINGDNDIIHYDHGYALKRGFPGTLGHGLMVMGYAAELATREYGDAWYRRGRLHVKWTDPVFPDDEVAMSLDDSGELQGTVGSRTVLVGEASLSK